MDMNFDLLAKLEQQGPKPKKDAPSHDLDEELLPGEEEEEETDYTTNFGDNDDDGDDGDDGGDDGKPFLPLNFFFSSLSSSWFPSYPFVRLPSSFFPPRSSFFVLPSFLQLLLSFLLNFFNSLPNLVILVEPYI
jgi:hypothetical protein